MLIFAISKVTGFDAWLQSKRQGTRKWSVALPTFSTLRKQLLDSRIGSVSGRFTLHVESGRLTSAVAGKDEIDHAIQVFAVSFSSLMKMNRICEIDQNTLPIKKNSGKISP